MRLIQMPLLSNCFVLKLCFILLMILAVSGCSNPSSGYDIPLSANGYTKVVKHPNRNIAVQVADKFKNKQFIGGSDLTENINFQGIVPWLRTRLLDMNALNCTLTTKNNIDIAIKKLYVNMESQVLVIALVLNTKISMLHGRTLIKNYRGDCKAGFFGLSERTEILSCLNSSLSLIINDMKRDVCEFNQSSKPLLRHV